MPQLVTVDATAVRQGPETGGHVALLPATDKREKPQWRLSTLVSTRLLLCAFSVTACPLCCRSRAACDETHLDAGAAFAPVLYSDSSLHRGCAVDAAVSLSVGQVIGTEIRLFQASSNADYARQAFW